MRSHNRVLDNGAVKQQSRLNSPPPGAGARSLPRHHIYYFTRPDFLKHDHIHRSKVEALRAAGLNASLIAFVRQSLFEQRQQEYLAAAADGVRQVIVIPEGQQANEHVRRFFRRRLLTGKRLVVHMLFVDPGPVLSLKQFPVLGRRLKCLIEFEGDLASEWLYRWAYHKLNPPPDLPPPEFKESYDGFVAEQKKQLLEADGAILVTPAHLALWEERLGRKLKALTLPTSFDLSPCAFSAADRARVRHELRLEEKTVIVYSGSVSLEWQRFECLCQLVADLAGRGHPLHLLALVHSDGQAAAEKIIEEKGISSCATLKAVAPAAMGAYLSAADVAAFLRHNHAMNRIVTSAKMGEYLAAGLPLLSTWASTYYKPFVEEHSAAIALKDTLELPAGFDAAFEALAAKGKDTAWRAAFSQAFRSTLSEAKPLQTYVQFITGFLR